MIDPEIQMALDVITARLEAEVLRLYLKMRRYDKANVERIKALEERIARLTPVDTDDEKPQ